LYPFEDQGVDDIVKHADTAMYSAKQNGRNQIAFYLSELHEKVVARLALEKDLRKAINDNQLDVYYQPLLDSNENILAVEALVRWKHDEHGYINPEEFIAIAEDTGLIYSIGDFVLNKAVNDITLLNKEHDFSINLSVNISPHQFRKAEFFGVIKKVIDTYKLEKNFLTLEVTERIAIENLNATVEKFNLLQSIGVRLSLDDFGTGYSSLSHLKILPIDEIKIDKSFVFDIEDDQQDALLVKTIIKIAHQFGLDIVAEGVETKEQLNFLKNEDCTILQGFYFSKPIPITALTELLLSK
jgi:EAL domain-containing protein (putative c-di-GMP-specific phosphodiesterase class I)